MKAAAALIMLLGAAAPALAQSVTPAERGSQCFRVILHRLGLKPLESTDDAFTRPSKTLIILFGATEALDDAFRAGGLRQYLGAGGAVLFTSDRSPLRGPRRRAGFIKGDDDVIFAELECRIVGDLLDCHNPEPGALYRDELQACPLLQRPIRLDIKSDLDLLGNLRVATNHPSLLQYRNDAPALNKRRVIAELPTMCLPVDGAWGYQPPLQDRPLVAMADSLGAGRYAVVADHSIFSNQMMLQTDNDNIQFTVRLTNWLTQDGRRDRVLFLDDGVVRKEFDVNLDFIDPPLPHPDVLGPLLDRLIDGLEGEGFFDRAINNLIPAHRAFRYLLLSVTFLAVAYALYRVTAGRFRPDPTAARLPERLNDLAAPAAAPPDDLAAAARELARRALERAFGGELGVRPPEVAAGPAWAKRIGGLWGLATGAAVTRMTPRRLERLGRTLDELHAAIERGQVRLVPGGSA